MQRQDERRKSQRFNVRAGAIVMLKRKTFFVFGAPTYIKLGPIIDISENGIAVQYIESRDRLKKSLKLTIATLDGDIIIEDVLFDTVSDYEIALLPDKKRVRRRSMKFKNLTEYQTAWLSCIIHNLQPEPGDDDSAGRTEKPEILNNIC